MNGPLPIRTERTTVVRSTAKTPPADPAQQAKDAADQAAIAAQHAAFDFELAERAEILREHEALQALIVEELKNEDEIMKKWIALI